MWLPRRYAREARHSARNAVDKAVVKSRAAGPIAPRTQFRRNKQDRRGKPRDCRAPFLIHQGVS